MTTLSENFIEPETRARLLFLCLRGIINPRYAGVMELGVLACGLGPTPALTVRRTVIHSRSAALLRVGLKRRQLPLSSTRIHDRKSLEAPGYFGSPERFPFFGGASVADRLTREKIRTHFPTLKAPMPVWWNWQTPWIQNPVSARTCGFDPRHRHHPGIPKALFYGGFRDFHIQFRR